MHVFEVLKKDHQTARELFSKIEGTSQGARKTREDLFQKLRQELIAHTKAEESVFYPELKKKQEARGIIEEGINEHHQVDSLLDKLDGLDVASEEWLDGVRDLKAKVEHHVEEEESEIFEKAKSLLPEDQLEQMGSEIEKAKRG